jgi:hypothetical protein
VAEARIYDRHRHTRSGKESEQVRMLIACNDNSNNNTTGSAADLRAESDNVRRSERGSRGKAMFGMDTDERAVLLFLSQTGSMAHTAEQKHRGRLAG